MEEGNWVKIPIKKKQIPSVEKVGEKAFRNN